MRQDAAIVVNDEGHGMDRVLRSLRVTEGTGAFRNFARRRLVFQLAEREGLRLSPDALQGGVDEWRYRRHLERTDDTARWLAQTGVTLDDVADHVAAEMLEEALVHHITGGQVEAFFTENKLEFDEAEVSWILTADRGVAAEITTQVRDEGVDFGRSALRHSEDDRTRRSGGYVGRLRRRDLPEGVAAKVFSGKGGDTVGPIEAGGSFSIYRVEEIHPAPLTEYVKEEIRQLLFDRWLASEIQAADIAYFYTEGGPAGEAVLSTPDDDLVVGRRPETEGESGRP